MRKPGLEKTNMKLLERYLQEIYQLLPVAERDDIISELEDNVRSEVEDIESKVDRPINEAEEEELLRRFDHPAIVAGRYRGSSSCSFRFGKVEIVGPELFPFYMRGLVWIGGATAAVVTMVWIGLMMAGKAHFGNLISGLGLHIGIQFAIQTAVWGTVQAHARKFPRQWKNPSAEASGDPQRVSRLESFLQLVIILAILPAVHGMLWAQNLRFGPLELAPIWHLIYFPVMALLMIDVIQALVNLVRPDLVQLRFVSHVVVTSGFLALCGVLLAEGEWVLGRGRSGHLVASSPEADALNNIFFWGIVIVAITLLVHLVWEVGLQVRHRARARRGRF